MSDPTKDQIAAAVSTPVRDLRDEVWVRVYADNLRDLQGKMHPINVAIEARKAADFAVEHMSVPKHRRAEVGL